MSPSGLSQDFPLPMLGVHPGSMGSAGAIFKYASIAKMATIKFVKRAGGTP
jgi:hypothetical protein